MIEIFYLAYNRKEFTKASMQAMLANTDWNQVGKLVIYDDGSTDGTKEYLDSLDYPVETEIRGRRLGGPVAIMNDFIPGTRNELFCKVDSDTMLPPFWLQECLKVMEASQELDLLGIEAFNPVAAGETARGYNPARWIGGIGLMRKRCFITYPKPNGRFGFTQWQRESKAIKGWINPSLPVFLLDRMPTDPWLSLSQEYVAKGWQREWPLYQMEQETLWEWLK
jgi:glycosyltransferase involved in cell wall biosynthesis